MGSFISSVKDSIMKKKHTILTDIDSYNESERYKKHALYIRRRFRLHNYE